MKLSKAILAVTFAAGILVVQQAQAHAHLKSSEPVAKSEVSASPTALTLSFTEDLEASFSGAELKDSQGGIVKTGKAALSPDSKSVLIVPVNSPLKAGSYEVDWHALSVDGHKTKGNYNFSVK